MILDKCWAPVEGETLENDSLPITIEVFYTERIILSLALVQPHSLWGIQLHHTPCLSRPPGSVCPSF